MNKKNFIKILQNPENLTSEELSFLDEINREFPYFQTSKAIFLKTLKENDDIKFIIEVFCILKPILILK